MKNTKNTAALAACFAGEDWKILLGAIDGNEKDRATLLGYCAEYGARRGKGAAEWAAMELWGGRVGSARKAADTARAFLKGYDDGDPAVYDGMPHYGEGDTWSAEALPLALTWAYIQRFDAARDALRGMIDYSDYADLCELCEETARQAFDDARDGELISSAQSAIE